MINEYVLMNNNGEFIEDAALGWIATTYNLNKARIVNHARNILACFHPEYKAIDKKYIKIVYIIKKLDCEKFMTQDGNFYSDIKKSKIFLSLDNAHNECNIDLTDTVIPISQIFAESFSKTKRYETIVDNKKIEQHITNEEIIDKEKLRKFLNSILFKDKYELKIAESSQNSITINNCIILYKNQLIYIILDNIDKYNKGDEKALSYAYNILFNCELNIIIDYIISINNNK